MSKKRYSQVSTRVSKYSLSTLVHTYLLYIMYQFFLVGFSIYFGLRFHKNCSIYLIKTLFKHFHLLLIDFKDLYSSVQHRELRKVNQHLIRINQTKKSVLQPCVYSETNRETFGFDPFLITVLFQIRT